MDTIEFILNKIKIFNGVFPQKEIEILARKKEHAIPKLLRIMEDVRVNYEVYIEEDYMFHIYATYLLAELRVKECFPFFMDIAALPGVLTFDLYGDGVTEDFQKIMASVYNGNILEFFRLIENPKANIFVRDQSIGALIILVLEGLLEREYIAKYLQKLLIETGKKEDPEFVAAMVDALSILDPEEFIGEISWAFAFDLVATHWIGYDCVLNRVEMGQEAIFAELKEGRHFQFIHSAIDELSKWSCFNGEREG